MSTQSVIKIQDFCYHHGCEMIIIEEFVEYGIFTPTTDSDIPVHHLARVEKALRLHRELGVNTAGIDIILNLLDRLENHQDVEELSL